MNLAPISEILETYEGRDKFLKTLSYAAKLATGFTYSIETANKWKHFGSQMSECRVMMRILDDIPLLHETLSYGWGKKEPDQTLRWLKLARNLVDLIASPIEHICWAGDHKLIKINDYWDRISTLLWITYIYLSLLISIRRLSEIGVKQESELSDWDSASCKEEAFNKIRMLNFKKSDTLLTCIRLSVDLSYAISYLPPGHLWGQCMQSWQVGALGTLSSVIGLYQVFAKKVKAQ